jgi:mono/diheme cytochrome c family protein
MTGKGSAAGLLLFAAAAIGCAQMSPEEPAGTNVHFLDQNWDAGQRDWFYHASQGTRIMPYKWFLALEQPVPGSAGRTQFADPAYLARFGFIADRRSDGNPDGLPVGFAWDDGSVDGSQSVTMVGLTCAACHTGQIDYNGASIRIDGGPAMTDLGAFQKQLGIAAFATYIQPFRFDRFARKVLEANDTPEARKQLHQHLGQFIDAGKTEAEAAKRQQLYPVAEGYGRLDALGRGGNFVFGTQLGDPRNFAVADGPVSYPGLWDASWFDWVQYNGAIRQPMGRNVAEAMGVRSAVKLSGPSEDLHKSTVRLDNIHEMEQLLAGPKAGEGLTSPRWPEDLLPKIDAGRQQRGKQLYAQMCSGCHDGGWSQPDRHGRQYRQIVMKPVDDIGTDPKAAMNFVQRKAYLNASDKTPVPAATGLKKVTDAVIERWLDDNAVPSNQRDDIKGYRDNDWRAVAAYRARPLNGIWATAPYLHNGSVPNLYQMLVPADQRDTAFSVGSRQFDPKMVGFSTDGAADAFQFDTSIPGNSNRGHEFRNAPLRNGVIGRELTENERWDLIEYLKSL